MTIEEQIAALIEKAEPLRGLPDEEAEAAGLPLIVDQINALRAREVAEKLSAAVYQAQALSDQAQEVRHEAEFAQTAAEVAPKRGRGRPKKAE